jgi:hypothetical protein
MVDLNLPNFITVGVIAIAALVLVRAATKATGVGVGMV